MRRPWAGFWLAIEIYIVTTWLVKWRFFQIQMIFNSFQFSNANLYPNYRMYRSPRKWCSVIDGTGSFKNGGAYSGRPIKEGKGLHKNCFAWKDEKIGWDSFWTSCGKLNKDPLWFLTNANYGFCIQTISDLSKIRVSTVWYRLNYMAATYDHFKRFSLKITY